jgi:hypothetical protein
MYQVGNFFAKTENTFFKGKINSAYTNENKEKKLYSKPNEEKNESISSKLSRGGESGRLQYKPVQSGSDYYSSATVVSSDDKLSLSYDTEIKQIYDNITQIQTDMLAADSKNIDNTLIASFETQLSDASTALAAYSGYADNEEYQISKQIVDQAVTDLQVLYDTGLPTGIDETAMNTTLDTIASDLDPVFSNIETMMNQYIILPLSDEAGNFGDVGLIQFTIDEIDDFINSGDLSAETLAELQIAKTDLETEQTIIQTLMDEGQTQEMAFFGSMDKITAVEASLAALYDDPSTTTLDKEALTSVNAKFSTLLGEGGTEELISSFRDNLRGLMDDLDTLFAGNNTRVEAALQDTYDNLPALIDTITQSLIDGGDLDTILSDSLASATTLRDQMEADIIAATNLNNNELEEANSQLATFDQAIQFTSFNMIEGDLKNVNTGTGSNQTEPVTVSFDDGSYLVSWLSNESGFTSIQGQLYTADGAKDGTELTLVAGGDVNNNTEFDVISLEEGGFYLSFEGGQNSGVKGQKYDQTGAAVGAEVTIDSSGSDVSMTQLNDGNIVFSYQGSGADTNIEGSIFDTSGNQVGSSFTITDNLEDETNPQITALSSGGFAVVYTDEDNQQGDGGDVDGSGVYGRVFDATGTQQGSEFQVNTETADDQIVDDIISLDDGGFTVLYRTDTGGGNGTTTIQTRSFDDSGTATSDEYVVQSTTDTIHASMTQLLDGGFAISFNDVNDVYVQRFDSNSDAMGGAIKVFDSTKQSGDAKVSLSASKTGFVVAYERNDGVTDSTDIYAKQYVILDEGKGFDEDAVMDQNDVTSELAQSINYQMETLETMLADTSTQADAQEIYDRTENLLDDLNRINVTEEDRLVLDTYIAQVETSQSTITSYVNTTDLTIAAKETTLSTVASDLDQVFGLLDTKTSARSTQSYTFGTQKGARNLAQNGADPSKSLVDEIFQNDSAIKGSPVQFIRSEDLGEVTTVVSAEKFVDSMTPKKEDNNSLKLSEKYMKQQIEPKEAGSFAHTTLAKAEKTAEASQAKETPRMKLDVSL